jgi:CheY-like chemotaxis protein
MDSTMVNFLEKVTPEFVRIIPALLWVGLAFYIFRKYHRKIHDELLPNLVGLKALGVELSFANVKDSITSAIELAKKSTQWPVVIPEEDEQRVLNRVKKHVDLFRNVRILWIDDVPDSPRNERAMLRRLQADVEMARSTAEAEKLLQSQVYDLILSDMKRDGDNQAGLKFLQDYAPHKKRAPVIFYVGYPDPTKGVPAYAFGITHRPDELLHLIMDALERVKS